MIKISWIVQASPFIEQHFSISHQPPNLHNHIRKQKSTNHTIIRVTNPIIPIPSPHPIRLPLTHAPNPTSPFQPYPPMLCYPLSTFASLGMPSAIAPECNMNRNSFKSRDSYLHYTYLASYRYECHRATFALHSQHAFWGWICSKSRHSNTR